MPTDIFDFWAGCPDDAHEHPADAKVFSRVKHHFELDCLPIAFTGPLRTAPVVLLFLSPGYDEYDTDLAHTKEGQDWYRTQRIGIAPWPNHNEHEPAWNWWSRIVRQFDVKPEAVRDKIAVLNIGAYHSRKFHDWHMLTALPSSRVSMDWAQGVLFPEAEAGKRFVICLRSAKLWGLRKGECNGGTLYAPDHGRNGIMHHGTLRDQISMEVRERVS